MQTAILWDIENVTPRGESNFVESLLSFVSSHGGKVSSSLSFADWGNVRLKKISQTLAENGFELIHIPKSRKNSADMSLITHAIEMIFNYPHLQRFVILTGDADFRPLIHTLKKHGKETWIICDAKNASEDLLVLADEYFDYRGLEESAIDLDAETETEKAVLSKEAAYELFLEAVTILETEKKKPNSGLVKIKMKLLNDDFDERKLGFSRWNDFVRQAVKQTSVEVVDADKGIFAAPKVQIKRNESIPHIFRALLDTLPAKSDWTPFSKSSQGLKELGIDIRKYGYSKFMRLASDAEKRGYVETSNSDSQWLLRKTAN